MKRCVNGTLVLNGLNEKSRERGTTREYICWTSTVPMPSVFPRWCYSTENGDNISGHEIYRNLRPVLFSLPTSALSSEMNLRSVAGCNGPLTLSSLMKPIRWILVGRKRQSKGVSMLLQKRFLGVYDLPRATTCRMTWLSRIFSFPFSRH